MKDVDMCVCMCVFLPLKLSDQQLEVVSRDVCCLSDAQMPLFARLVTDTITKLQSGELCSQLN